MSTIDFPTWLQTEMDRRNWNQSELSKQSGLEQTTISRILNGNRGVGTLSCQKIANAMGIPVEIVLARAGLISQTTDRKKLAEQITAYKLNELNTTQLDEVLQFIEFIQERDERKVTYKQKRKREGATPPAAIKE